MTTPAPLIPHPPACHRADSLPQNGLVSLKGNIRKAIKCTIALYKLHLSTRDAHLNGGDIHLRARDVYLAP